MPKKVNKSRRKKVARRTRSHVPAVPRELDMAIREKKCALFVGAGLSVAAGYPRWTTLLSNLVEVGRAKKYGINAATERELKRLIQDSNKLLLVAEELRERFGKEQFEKELVAVFRKDLQPEKMHHRLMDIPFSLAITTNYDLLLERAFIKKHADPPPAFTALQPAEIAEALWRNDYFILKAHGDVNNRASLIITERDYREIIYRSHGYRAALASIFTTRKVLFLGVSFADPELKLLLAYLHDAFHGGMTHYALVPSNEFSECVVNRWRKDFGIVCLCYTSTKNHPQVGEFVRSLPKISD